MHSDAIPLRKPNEIYLLEINFREEIIRERHIGSQSKYKTTSKFKTNTYTLFPGVLKSTSVTDRI